MLVQCMTRGSTLRTSTGILFKYVSSHSSHRMGQSTTFSMSTTIANVNHFIATSSTVEFTKTNLIAFHEWSHLPWAAEIAIVTITARFLVTFPLQITQRKVMNRLAALEPEILDISEKFKIKVARDAYLQRRSEKGALRVYYKMLMKEKSRLFIRDNCHPVKAFTLPLVQFPVWVILSHTFRNMARMYPDPNDPLAQTVFDQLQNEGWLWFHDLTVPDPTGFFPVATALINLSIIQLYVNHRRKSKKQDSIWMKVLTNGSRLFSLIIIPIGLVAPANMPFYWFVSSSVGLVQNILLLNPNVIKYLNLESPKIKENEKNLLKK